LRAGERAARALVECTRTKSDYREIPGGLDFKIIGEENIPKGPIWVLARETQSRIPAAVAIDQPR